MKYVTDLNEIFRILDECCGKPVYVNVGQDENGCEVAVPCYAIGDEHVVETKQGKVV